jgi:hypothetical protein
LKKTLSILTLFLLLSSTGNSITLKEAEELSVKNYPEIKKLELLRESSLKEAEAVRRERGTLAAPYAGITRIRFQGFLHRRSQELRSTPAALLILYY